MARENLDAAKARTKEEFQPGDRVVELLQIPGCRLATISDLYLIQVMVSDRHYLAAALGLTEIANIASALIFKE